MSTQHAGVIFAGHETTNGGAGTAFLGLLTKPRECGWLCAGPSVIPGAAERTQRHLNRMLGYLAFDQQRRQLSEARRVVADPLAFHDMTAVIDYSDIVMVCGPIDSAMQSQSVSSTPSADVGPVPGGPTGRPHRRTPKSVISLAVGDARHCMTSFSRRVQGSEELSGSQPCGRFGQANPPLTRRVCTGAPFSQGARRRELPNITWQQAPTRCRPLLRPVALPY